MARQKNSLTEEYGSEEVAMMPGATPSVNPDDEFDPGILLDLNTVLPQLPNIPGFHCAWAPVKSDVINDPSRWIKMYQMGYRPITLEEFAAYGLGMVGQTYAERDNPEFQGCVKVMDVVAVKVPSQIYEKITKYLEKQILRTEADLKSRPTQFRNVNPNVSQIFVDHRSGTTGSMQSAIDKL